MCVCVGACAGGRGEPQPHTLALINTKQIGTRANHETNAYPEPAAGVCNSAAGADAGRENARSCRAWT